MSQTFGNKFIAVPELYWDTWTWHYHSVLRLHGIHFPPVLVLMCPSSLQFFGPYTVGLATFSWLFEGFMADFFCAIPGLTVSREEPASVWIMNYWMNNKFEYPFNAMRLRALMWFIS